MNELTKKIQTQFNKMCTTGKLFRSKLTGRQIWEIYINSFEKGYDPIFRDPESSTHNCNHCKNFIRRYGNIVTIDKNFNIVTMFDTEVPKEYDSVVKAISNKLKQSIISDVFFETFSELKSLPYESCKKDNLSFQLGMDKNVKRYTKEEAEKFDVVKPNEIRTFNHLHLFVTKQFVDTTGKSVDSIMADYRDGKNVFQRTMEEIPLDTLNLVRDLINQGSLLDGKTHLHKLEQILPLKRIYDQIPDEKKDNWCWFNSYNFQFAKFKNELIGVLCTELAEGEDLNQACQNWNKRVDPVNYMKAVAPITKKQIEQAKKFVEENSYESSFDRRFATIDDIKASEIYHLSSDKDGIKSVSIFDDVKPTSTRHKRSEFDGIEEVPIEKFMTDILPGCESVEAFLSNKHEGNLVSLTTAKQKDSKPIFRWPNNYSWTFNGNLAGKSQIKQAVKTAGGNVSGVLRFSLIWNDEGSNDRSDLDAWCRQPDGKKIGFSTGYRKDSGNVFTNMTGQLDLDNTDPCGKLAIENIYFTDKDFMKNGTFVFWVNQYTARQSKGFKAEIEFDGETFTYEYNKPLRTNDNVPVANVTLKGGEFDIEHKLPEQNASKELYGLPSEQFHKVNLICLSPNHWGDNNIGNKHYFFMLDKCKTPEQIRSFHSENLIPELAKHRKVLEVLGNTTMIEPTEKQLSGLGFNATVRDELVVKLKGSFKRILKIKF